MRRDRPTLVRGMNQNVVAAEAEPREEPQDVPVLVSLGAEDVPVCEDGSCSL
jgi:hypothetical protein